MTLNKIQKIIVYVWLILFVACFAFPPMSVKYNFSRNNIIDEGKLFIGYGSIIEHQKYIEQQYVEIDVVRLVLQWITITIIMLTLVTLINSKKRKLDDKAS